LGAESASKLTILAMSYIIYELAPGMNKSYNVITPSRAQKIDAILLLSRASQLVSASSSFRMRK